MVKLLVIGVGGLSNRLVEKFKDKLPNLSKIKNYTKSEAYLSGEVPHTGPNWSSIYTGKSPRQHGITSGGWLDARVFHSDIKGETIFQLVNKKGLSYGSWFMPITFRPFSGDKWCVAGFPATHRFIDQLINPKEMKEYLPHDFIKETPSYLITNRDNFKEWTKSLRNKFRAFKNLPSEYRDLDVIFYGMTYLNRVCHLTKDKNKGLKVYKEIDKLIGALLNYLNPEYFVICSDHGFANDTVHDKWGYCGASDAITLPNEFKTSDVFNCMVQAIDLSLGNRPNADETEKEVRKQLRKLGYI